MTSGKLTFAIGGMRCPDCVTAIENAVMPLPGVLYAGASLAGATLTVRPGPGFRQADLVSRVVALGYTVGDQADAIAPSPGPCPCRW
ncbi:MAG: cation transporter [Alphaproteobacteria bacterium]|jgi:copper chaperone CopZ|uniref:cation transporter n=1 Tax=Devosia sp. XGJD_8 TaxID=3391187 RepID=UPI001DC53365|nr:cation transporter [Alphaproteobacteria bacterium]MBU1561575.1 cation transporter [Alphaproteobacteria bacterium]MBU2303289.1 cation transporter [Alphaproteobacteria bacterium]MBU2367645.1 cation transporter [Alphaproteobacteria bacterium]